MSSQIDEMAKTSEGSGGKTSPDNPETDSGRGSTRRTRSSTASAKSGSPRLITYSPDELLSFKLSALSSKWPNFLDESFKNARGHWDPDRWHQNRKRGSTPPPEMTDKAAKPAADRPPSSLSTEGKPRRDPKDRIKAEQNDIGIVLSPQRRSFLTGCQGSSGAGNGQQTASSVTVGKKEDVSVRPDTASRRVGSGRILNRERDREDDPGFDRERDNRRFERRGDERFNSNNFNDPRRRRDGPGEPGQPQRRRENEDNRRRVDLGDDARRRIEECDDRRRGSDDRWYARRDRDDRPTHRRFGNYHEPEEPEWMSASIDQGELMELHGFDDSPEKEVSKKKNNVAENASAPKKGKELWMDSRDGEGLVSGKEHQQSKPDRSQSGDQMDAGFNIDDIIHMDVIPGLASILDDDQDYGHASNVDAGEHEVHGGSRFSQFFQRPSQPKAEERRSSIQDELCVGASILREINEGAGGPVPSVRIPSPGDPSAYFAPISPAAKTTNEPHHANALMNMLRVGAAGDRPSLAAPSIADLQGKNVRSVEELEADIKQMIGLEADRPRGRPHEDEAVHLFQQHQQLRNLHQQLQHSKKMEMSPFEKFAAMIAGGEQAPPQQNVLQQMIQNREGTRVTSGGLIRPSPLPANAPTEQEILAGMIGPRPPNTSLTGSRGTIPGAVPVASNPQTELFAAIYRAPFNPDVLKRPEARALQTALAQGHVTVDILLHHFAHGQMPPLQREILLNILKLVQSQGHLSQVPQAAHLPNRGGGLSPLPPDTLAILQQQRLSPGLLSGGGGGLAVVSPTHNQRIPSPQELQVHTQQIMQNALIKRKLEEQKENFRRRHGHEGQLAQQEKGRSTDSPLTFTPTSVMKKIAAERRDSDPVAKISVPELKVSQSSEKENGEGHQQLFNRTSPNLRGLGVIPPGSGMLPLPGSQQQPPNQLLLLQQQHQQQMRFQAMQQHIAAIAQQQAATSPTGFVDPQQLLLIQQQQQQMHFRQQHQPGFGFGVGQQQHPQPRGPILPSQQQAQQQQQPVSLTRFFSPEVLAQAQSGKAPAMPPLPTQKAKTLEEIERQAAAVRI